FKYFPFGRELNKYIRTVFGFDLPSSATRTASQSLTRPSRITQMASLLIGNSWRTTSSRCRMAIAFLRSNLRRAAVISREGRLRPREQAGPGGLFGGPGGRSDGRWVLQGLLGPPQRRPGRQAWSSGGAGVPARRRGHPR